mmetsp:Transcript_15180/g.20953  ORF Transcript_15180/g.20953 Transcript_15180/m.20953 type:complete len:260 (+) Transcript_15180:39-818(+)
MVWFQCDSCGDSLKKPKVAMHMRQCPAGYFTCIDCSHSFDRHSVQGHTQCVTEHQKYALSATKPGFKAPANSTASNGNGSTPKGAPPSGDGDTEFLSVRAPWLCSCCNTTCTSAEALAGHAGGKKHRNKVKATLKAREAASKPAFQEEIVQEAREPEASVKEPTSRKKRKSEIEAKNSDSSKQQKAIKWKKRITEELSKNEGSEMDVKKLRKHVINKLKHDNIELGTNGETMKEDFMETLKSSRKFVLDGTSVKLADGI